MKSEMDIVVENFIRMATINTANIQSSCISATPNFAITGAENIPTEPPRPRVTTCKNCGAPVHNNVCEYCGTGY